MQTKSCKIWNGILGKMCIKDCNIIAWILINKAGILRLVDALIVFIKQKQA